MGIVTIILTGLYDFVDFFVDRIKAGKCFICNYLGRCSCVKHSPSPKIEVPELTL